MSEVIVDKYAKALIESFDEDVLMDVLKDLEVIALAFEVEEFKSMIDSPIVDNDSKEKLILSLFEKELDPKFSNFLKILSQNRRFSLVPDILSEIRTMIASANNKYKGIIYSNNDLSDEKIKEVEFVFSKKFNADINLEFQKGSYNGIKVDIEELGVEISFSMDRLKQDMSEYILKAI